MSVRIADDEAPVSNAGEVDVAALQAENESLRDRVLRALADAENTRRRAERAEREARQFAIADFARELLPVLDNLLRPSRVAVVRRRPRVHSDAAGRSGRRSSTPDHR